MLLQLKCKSCHHRQQMFPILRFNTTCIYVKQLKKKINKTWNVIIYILTLEAHNFKTNFSYKIILSIQFRFIGFPKFTSQLKILT